MNFSIIPVYSGKKAKTYTIQFENSELSEYYQFVFDHKDNFPTTILELNEKLKNMVKTHGLIEEFFTRECPESHNVFRIKNTDELRLYCIKFSNVAIILGRGGLKIPGTIKLSENPYLQDIVNQLMKIEDLIVERIKSKEIKVTDDLIEGNLNFSLED